MNVKSNERKTAAPADLADCSHSRLLFSPCLLCKLFVVVVFFCCIVVAKYIFSEVLLYSEDSFRSGAPLIFVFKRPLKQILARGPWGRESARLPEFKASSLSSLPVLTL